MISAVRRVEFVNDRMLFIILRGHWCNIIVRNMYAPYENKSENIASVRNEDMCLISFLGVI
jgi:hypothetical protein